MDGFFMWLGGPGIGGIKGCLGIWVGLGGRGRLRARGVKGRRGRRRISRLLMECLKIVKRI